MLLAALMFGSLCGFAQSQQGPKLKRCAWSCYSTGLPNSSTTGDTEELYCSKESAPQLITHSQRKWQGRYNVPEEKVRELENLLRELKLSDLDGYRELGGKGNLYMLGVEYVDGTRYSLQWSVKRPRKEAKAALKAVQNFFASLIETLPDAQ